MDPAINHEKLPLKSTIEEESAINRTANHLNSFGGLFNAFQQSQVNLNQATCRE